MNFCLLLAILADWPNLSSRNSAKISQIALGLPIGVLHIQFGENSTKLEGVKGQIDTKI